MKAITVRQPWAWAIVHGGKGVENRTRNIAGSYRGPIVIHAAKTYGDDWAAAAELIESVTGELIPPFDCGNGSETLGARTRRGEPLGQPPCNTGRILLPERLSPLQGMGDVGPVAPVSHQPAPIRRADPVPRRWGDKKPVRVPCPCARGMACHLAQDRVRDDKGRLASKGGDAQ